jgi:acyl-CoA thioesterase
MAPGDLEHALELSRLADGLWRAYADPNYEASNGMFGGWTAAVALRAVSDSAADAATPSALTINFVDKVDPGTDVRIHVRRVGASRSVSHWLSEMKSQGDHRTLAYASVVLAERRESDGHVDVKMPDAPDPDTLGVFHPPTGPHGERTIQRPITGFPTHGRTDTHSTSWVRELSGRAVDQLQLAYLSDHRAPRSWFWSDGPRLSATLTLSVYFHATAQELAAVGDDDLLSEAFGTRGAQSTSEEHLRLWSRQGALLATSVQMAWYR